MGKTVYVLFEILPYGDRINRGWFDDPDEARDIAIEKLPPWTWEVIAVDQGFRE